MTQKEILEFFNLDLDEENQKNFSGLFNLLVDYEIATREELQLLTSINGKTIKALLDCAGVRCELHSIEQIVKALADR